MNDRLEIASRLLARRFRYWNGAKDELQSALDAADALLELEMQTRGRAHQTSAIPVCPTCFGHADHAPTCPERPR